MNHLPHVWLAANVGGPDPIGRIWSEVPIQQVRGNFHSRLAGREPRKRNSMTIRGLP